MNTNSQPTPTKTQLTTLPAGSPSANAEPAPANHSPAVTTFLAARESLVQRQKQLEAELTDIQRILEGEVDVSIKTLGPMPTTTSSPAPPPALPARRSNAGLRQAVFALLAQGPLSKDDLVEKLLAQKFEFFGQPKPALDPVLYATRKIRRAGKLFALEVGQ